MIRNFVFLHDIRGQLVVCMSGATRPAEEGIAVEIQDAEAFPYPDPDRFVRVSELARSYRRDV